MRLVGYDMIWLDYLTWFCARWKHVITTTWGCRPLVMSGYEHVIITYISWDMAPPIAIEIQPLISIGIGTGQIWSWVSGWNKLLWRHNGDIIEYIEPAPRIFSVAAMILVLYSNQLKAYVMSHATYFFYRFPPGHCWVVSFFGLQQFASRIGLSASGYPIRPSKESNWSRVTRPVPKGANYTPDRQMFDF